MSRFSVVLLTRARLAREEAAQARKMAKSVNNRDAVQRLNKRAPQLEDLAGVYERLAKEMDDAVLRNRQISGELRELSKLTSRASA